MKKTQTLIDECEALTRRICEMVDEGAHPDKIAVAREVRDEKKAAIRARRDGRNYDTGLYA